MRRLPAAGAAGLALLLLSACGQDLTPTARGVQGGPPTATEVFDRFERTESCRALARRGYMNDNVPYEDESRIWGC